MRALIVVLSVCIGIIDAKIVSNGYIQNGLWEFIVYKDNNLINSTKKCIYNQKVWFIEALKKRSKCKAKLIDNSHNQEVWHARCKLLQNGKTFYMEIVYSGKKLLQNIRFKNETSITTLKGYKIKNHCLRKTKE